MPLTARNMPTAKDLIRPDGKVDLDLLLRSMNLSMTELAAVLGMSRDAVSKMTRLPVGALSVCCTSS